MRVLLPLVITWQVVLSSVISDPAADDVGVDSHFLRDASCWFFAVYNMFRCSVAKLLGIFTVIAWHFVLLLYAYNLQVYTLQKASQPTYTWTWFPVQQHFGNNTSDHSNSTGARLTDQNWFVKQAHKYHWFNRTVFFYWSYNVYYIL